MLNKLKKLLRFKMPDKELIKSKEKFNQPFQAGKIDEPSGMATQLRIARSLARIESVVNSLAELKSELIAASENPGSEGAMIKFKDEFSIKVQVVKALPVKNSPGTFSYIIALKNGKDLAPAGKTFNSKIQASEGGALKVVFVEISKNIDQKTKRVHYNMFAPRVVGKASSADSTATADALVQKSGGQVGIRPLPSKFKDLLNEDSYIKSFHAAAESWDRSEAEFAEAFFPSESKAIAQMQQTQHPVLDLPKEKKPYPFVIQEHIIGKSSHLDFRLAVNDHLIGFTLDDSGKLGDPLRFSNDAEKSSANKVLVQTKVRQPKAWLKTAGDVPPGEAGATKNLPARFKIIDKGMYELGAQKSNFIEVWLKGKKYDGRFVFRKLPRPSDSENAGKKPLVWFTWKPISQRPYVLSNIAINEGFVPPKGRSALPKEWEAKIPTALKWWEKNWTGAKAIEAITEIRKILLKRNILSLEKLNFTIKRHWWQGQNIKDSPVQHWTLNFSNGIRFVLDGNPLTQKKGINGVKKTITDKEFSFVGKIPSGQKDNPDKKIPLTVELIDNGKVNLIESTDNFMSMKFDGSKFRGFWIAKKNTGWVLESSQEGAKPKKLKNTELTLNQKNIISVQTQWSRRSLSEIADLAGCSKSAVQYQQRRMGLR